MTILHELSIILFLYHFSDLNDILYLSFLVVQDSGHCLSECSALELSTVLEQRMNRATIWLQAVGHCWQYLTS